MRIGCSSWRGDPVQAEELVCGQFHRFLPWGMDPVGQPMQATCRQGFLRPGAPAPSEFCPSFGKVSGGFLSSWGREGSSKNEKGQDIWLSYSSGVGDERMRNLGLSEAKQYTEDWINNKVLMYSTGNYIQYSLMNCNEKNKKKNIYFCMCVTESVCCATELKATLKISHTSIQFFRKEQECPMFLLTLCFFTSESWPLFSPQRMPVILLNPHDLFFFFNF